MDFENESIKRKHKSSSEEECDSSTEESDSYESDDGEEEEEEEEEDNEAPSSDAGISKEALEQLMEELKTQRELIKNLQDELRIAKAEGQMNKITPPTNSKLANNQDLEFPTLEPVRRPKPISPAKTSKPTTGSTPKKTTNTTTSKTGTTATGSSSSDTIKNLPIIVLYNENAKKMIYFFWDLVHPLTEPTQK
ncbi:bromodomain-containing protein 2-like [Drosophila eugracilis]|uniref:bromodomain-containing protein 2-like n=1 Tax=Drosophila eugracilis TaxID=29029 RepID=UPI0007E66CA2|nr:bromodomain-containing protein 2-like [Drosophila eugracilis]